MEKGRRKCLKTFFGYIRNFFKGLDNFLIFLCIISPVFGFVLVYSATQNTDSALRNVLIQSVCLVIGLAVMFLICLLLPNKVRLCKEKG